MEETLLISKNSGDHRKGFFWSIQKSYDFLFKRSMAELEVEFSGLHRWITAKAQDQVLGGQRDRPQGEYALQTALMGSMDGLTN